MKKISVDKIINTCYKSRRIISLSHGVVLCRIKTENHGIQFIDESNLLILFQNILFKV